MWDLSSLTRDGTHVPCKVDSLPLDHQGSPNSPYLNIDIYVFNIYVIHLFSRVAKGHQNLKKWDIY